MAEAKAFEEQRAVNRRVLAEVEDLDAVRAVPVVVAVRVHAHQLRLHQDVLRSQISVRQAKSLRSLQSQEDLSHHQSSLVLRKQVFFCPLKNEIKDRNPMLILSYDHQLVFNLFFSLYLLTDLIVYHLVYVWMHHF